MPVRHGQPGAAVPASWMSPPPFTQWSTAPDRVRMSDARSIAQPFTMAEGSRRPRGYAVK